MVHTLINNFWVIAGSILLACLGGFIAYRNARIGRAAEAGTLLRAAFEPQLTAFESNYDLNAHMLHGLLVNAYPEHRAAVRELRRHLGPIQRVRFERAWRAYHDGNEGAPNFLPYYLGDNCRTVFINRVQALLHVTNRA